MGTHISSITYGTEFVLPAGRNNTVALIPNHGLPGYFNYEIGISVPCALRSSTVGYRTLAGSSVGLTLVTATNARTAHQSWVVHSAPFLGPRYLNGSLKIPAASAFHSGSAEASCQRIRSLWKQRISNRSSHLVQPYALEARYHSSGTSETFLVLCAIWGVPSLALLYAHTEGSSQTLSLRTDSVIMSVNGNRGQKERCRWSCRL